MCKLAERLLKYPDSTPQALPLDAGQIISRKSAKPHLVLMNYFSDTFSIGY